MAEYDFSNITSGQALGNRATELEKRIKGATRFASNVKDVRQKESAQKKLTGFQNEREALFRFGAGGNVSGLFQDGKELTPDNRYMVDRGGERVAYNDTFGAPDGPVSITEPPAYSVYNDPFYMQQLQQAQSAFNTDRTNAQASMDFQNIGTNRQLAERPATAEDSRRRLAGNFASRGMGGGRAGALSREEAEMNARELTSRTGLREQMAELNRQFTSNFGAAGTDWLGTSRGASAQQGAINTALQNRLAGLTTVGQ